MSHRPAGCMSLPLRLQCLECNLTIIRMNYRSFIFPTCRPNTRFRRNNSCPPRTLKHAPHTYTYAPQNNHAGPRQPRSSRCHQPRPSPIQGCCCNKPYSCTLRLHLLRDYRPPTTTTFPLHAHAHAHHTLPASPSLFLRACGVLILLDNDRLRPL